MVSLCYGGISLSISCSLREIWWLKLQLKSCSGMGVLALKSPECWLNVVWLFCDSRILVSRHWLRFLGALAYSASVLHPLIIASWSYTHNFWTHCTTALVLWLVVVCTQPQILEYWCFNYSGALKTGTRTSRAMRIICYLYANCSRAAEYLLQAPHNIWLNCG